MIAKNAKEKLTNAVIYFISHTNNCGKLKLYKLLSILDFRHFNETGRSVTIVYGFTAAFYPMERGYSKLGCSWVAFEW